MPTIASLSPPHPQTVVRRRLHLQIQAIPIRHRLLHRPDQTTPAIHPLIPIGLTCQCRAILRQMAPSQAMVQSAVFLATEGTPPTSRIGADTTIGMEIIIIGVATGMCPNSAASDATHFIPALAM